MNVARDMQDVDIPVGPAIIAVIACLIVLYLASRKGK